MLYSYKCPSCGWIGDRLCKIAERDHQVCTQATNEVVGHNYDPEYVAPITLYKPCGANLIREEISQTARMGAQWGQWTGKYG